MGVRSVLGHLLQEGRWGRGAEHGVQSRREAAEGLEHESCGGRLKDPRLLSLEERKPGSTKPQVV